MGGWGLRFLWKALQLPASLISTAIQNLPLPSQRNSLSGSQGCQPGQMALSVYIFKYIK